MNRQTPSTLTRLSTIQPSDTSESIDSNADRILRQIIANLRGEIEQIASELTSAEKLNLAAEIMAITDTLKESFQKATAGIQSLEAELNQKEEELTPTPISKVNTIEPKPETGNEGVTHRVVHIPSSSANQTPAQPTDKELFKNKLIAMQTDVFDVFDKKTAGFLYIHGFQYLGDLILHPEKTEKVKSILSDQAESINAKLEELQLTTTIDQTVKAEYKKWKAEKDRKNHCSPK